MNEKLRAILVPAIILLVFIGLVRGCANRMQRARAQQEEVKREEAAKAPQPLEPAVPQTSQFPEGLDAARIQYLVEADATFATPATSKFPKKYAAYDSVTSALARLSYIEKDIDDSVKLTREGSLRIEGLRDEGDHYSFTAGKRVFDRVVQVKPLAEDKVRVTLTWHWETNDAGKAVIPRTGAQTGAVADFNGTGGQWALSGWPNGLRQ